MEFIVKSTENSLPEAKVSPDFSTDTENILLINLQLWKRVIRRPGTSPGKLVTHL